MATARVLISFLGGVVALLAPCCVSVMLPAFFAAEIDLASQEGRALAAGAGVLFAPGVLVDGRPFGYGRLSERRLRRSFSRLAAGPH